MPRKQKLRPELVGIFDDLIDETIVVEPEYPKSREIDRGLVMFWRKEKCARCHTVYQGSMYYADPLLQVEIQKPIVYFGRLYGWKYVATAFRPVPDFTCYDSLPRRVETIETTIRVCPKCVHRPKVIYLEARA